MIPDDDSDPFVRLIKPILLAIGVIAALAALLGGFSR